MATNATAAPSAPTSLLTNYEAYAATTALHREQRKQPSSEPPRLLERNLHDLRGRAGPHISSKVPSNFRRNLAIRHLVNRFNTYDASAKVDTFKTFLQFALCFTRTEYQD